MACHAETAGRSSPTPAAANTVTNLHAFARLYGVVRWFHPSDAAASIDWDEFAIAGARRVATAVDRRALRAALDELFSPIAPTVHVVDSRDEFPAEPALQPGPTAGLEVVAWQHIGYGDTTIATDYASKRTHRDRVAALPGSLSAAVSQSLDASPYRGLRIRLRGKLRAVNHGNARLWLRVDRGATRGFFDNMIRRPVQSNTWVGAEIVGTVDPDAAAIVFGALMLGAGTTWYDDLELSSQSPDGSWRPIEIQQGGFEGSSALSSWHTGTSARQSTPIEGWSLSIDPRVPASGASSLRIEHATKVVREELFAAAPAPGETYDVDLGSGLRARVPISLYSRAGHTLGDGPGSERRAPGKPASPSGNFDALAGAADVIVVWNVLQHFWPYWDMVAVDWNAALDVALADALDDHGVDAHARTLDRLTAAAPDGHVRTRCAGESDLAYAPFAAAFIDGQVVVTASRDTAIARGDVIVSMDGQPTLQLLTEREARISGSPQWRRVRSLDQLGDGPPRTRLGVVALRDGTERRVTVERIDRRVLEEPSRPAIERLDDGVYYIDLDRAEMADIDAIMEQLAVAPGVVFDLRGRPNDNHQVLSHLLTRPDISTWMAIPHIVRPDSPSRPSSWGMEGWSLPVLQPHIAGRVAFLTGPAAVSYSESVMGLVDHYHLGAIVGAATAGTNGDIAEIALPTGCSTRFTARRVTKPDGSRHYLVGIQPTIAASRTIRGVIAGRDEILEAALAYVRAVK
jgi:C-terminal processing protease CtpA/Prc